MFIPDNYETAKVIADAALVFQDTLLEVLPRIADNPQYQPAIRDILLEILDEVPKHFQDQRLNDQSVALLGRWCADLRQCVPHIEIDI